MNDLPEDLIAFATDPAKIFEQAGTSMMERVASIRKIFKMPHFKVYHLRLLYRKHKISR